MAHSEARKPFSHPKAPLRLQDYMGEQKPANSLSLASLDIASIMSNPSFSAVAPVRMDGFSPEQRGLMDNRLFIERSIRGKIKPGTGLEREWDKFRKAISGQHLYIKGIFDKPAMTDLDFFHAGGMGLEMAERVEKEQQRTDIPEGEFKDAFSRYLTSTLELLSSKDIDAESSIGILDLRSVDQFVSQHSLLDFVNAITNVKLDDRDSQVLKGRDEITDFLVAYLRNSDYFRRPRRISGTDHDRRAMKQAEKAVATVGSLREMVSGALFDPEHPEHDELADKFIAEAERAKAHDVYAVHLAQLVYGKGDIAPLYWEAFGRVRGEEETELYGAIMDLAHTVNKIDGGYLFVDEAIALQPGEMKKDGELKGISDVATSISHILENSTAPQTYSVDLDVVADWAGLRKPNGMTVDLDKRTPNELSVELYYEEPDKTQRLEVWIDTDSHEIRWSIVEPIDAYPEYAGQLVHMVAEAVSAIEDTIEKPIEEASVQVPLPTQGVLFENIRSVPAQADRNPRKRRPHANIEESKLEVQQTTSPEKPQVKHVWHWHKDTREKILKRFSSGDKEHSISAVSRLNRDGVGEDKRLKGAFHDGKPVYELVAPRESGGSGIRIFGTERPGDEEGVKHYDIFEAEHRHHMKKNRGKFWRARS